jgi:dynein heavy chain, axonemal
METQKCYLDWESKLQEFKYDREVSYFNMLVPTIDTTKYSYILEKLLSI